MSSKALKIAAFFWIVQGNNVIVERDSLRSPHSPSKRGGQIIPSDVQTPSANSGARSSDEVHRGLSV